MSVVRDERAWCEEGQVRYAYIIYNAPQLAMSGISTVQQRIQTHPNIRSPSTRCTQYTNSTTVTGPTDAQNSPFSSLAVAIASMPTHCAYPRRMARLS